MCALTLRASRPRCLGLGYGHAGGVAVGIGIAVDVGAADGDVGGVHAAIAVLAGVDDAVTAVGQLFAAEGAGAVGVVDGDAPASLFRDLSHRILFYSIMRGG